MVGGPVAAPVILGGGSGQVHLKGVRSGLVGVVGIEIHRTARRRIDDIRTGGGDKPPGTVDVPSVVGDVAVAPERPGAVPVTADGVDADSVTVLKRGVGGTGGGGDFEGEAPGVRLLPGLHGGTGGCSGQQQVQEWSVIHSLSHCWAGGRTRLLPGLVDGLLDGAGLVQTGVPGVDGHRGYDQLRTAEGDGVGVLLALLPGGVCRDVPVVGLAVDGERDDDVTGGCRRGGRQDQHLGIGVLGPASDGLGKVGGLRDRLGGGALGDGAGLDVQGTLGDEGLAAGLLYYSICDCANKTTIYFQHHFDWFLMLLHFVRIFGNNIFSHNKNTINMFSPLPLGEGAGVRVFTLTF